jgi:hypothetical protein
MSALSNKISNNPVLLPELEIFYSNRYDFGSPQSAAKKQGENRTITFSTQRVWSGTLNEDLSLLGGDPVPNSHTQPLRAFHSGNACRQFRA